MIPGLAIEDAAAAHHLYQKLSGQVQGTWGEKGGFENRIMKSIQKHVHEARRTGDIEFFIEERSEDCVISRMPISKGALNPFGTIHAGAMLWLADVTATVLAIGDTQLGEKGQGFPLAINLNANLLGNQRGGEVRAESRFVRKGKRVTVVRTRVTGDNDRLLAEVTTNHIPAK